MTRCIYTASVEFCNRLEDYMYTSYLLMVSCEKLFPFFKSMFPLMSISLLKLPAKLVLQTVYANKYESIIRLMNPPRMNEHTVSACSQVRISSEGCVKMTVDQLIFLLNQQEELLPLLQVLKRTVLALS